MYQNKAWTWVYNTYILAYGHIQKANEILSKSEFEELKSKHSLYEFPEEDDLSEKNVSDTNLPMPNLLKFHDSYPECGKPCSRNNYEFYCNLHPEVYIYIILDWTHLYLYVLY